MSAGAPALDPALGHAVATQLRDELARGRWQSAQAHLEGVRDWDERAFLVGALGEWDGRPEWLAEWHRSAPRTSAIPALVRGAHSINWAWEARGAGVASTVGREAGSSFLSRLEAAERDLEEAAFRDAADPTPWALLITTGMGRSASGNVIAKRFAQAIKLDPDNRAAHARRLVSLTAKWGGAHEEMFRFAREAGRVAAPGSSLHTLVPWAHIEQWLSHAGSDPASAAAYLANDAVRQEILDEHRSLLAAPLTAPSFEMADRNIFAFSLWRWGVKAAAARELETIGGRVSRLPWGFMGDPRGVVAQARAECLGVGDEEVAGRMAELAAKAVAHARESHEVDLDLSWESLAAVDQLLAGYHSALGKEGDASRKQSARTGLAMMFGAYVGEVLRRRHGGCWLTRPETPAPVLYARGEWNTPFRLVGALLTHGPRQTLGTLLSPQADQGAAAASEPAPATGSSTPRPSAAERMKAEAQVLVDASRQVGRELAFDEASVETLDWIAARTREGLPKLAAGERKAAAVMAGVRIGAYLGELLCRLRGGVWRDDAPNLPPEIPGVDLGGALALTIPACVGLLEDGAASVGGAVVRTPSEYFRRVCRVQHDLLTRRIGGDGGLDATKSAMASDPALAEELVGTLSTALLTASGKWGLQLDFSEASLDGLEALLGELHGVYKDAGPGSKPTEEQLSTMGTIWGVYLGEVVRRHRGGRWAYADIPEAGRVLTLECGGRQLLPLSRATRRIRDGAVRDVREFYASTSGLQGGSVPPAGTGEGARPSDTLRAFAAEVASIAIRYNVPRSGVMPPFLLAKKGSSNTLESLAFISPARAMEHGRKRAASQPPEVTLVAFVYDVYAGAAGQPKQDTVLIEAHERGQAVGFVFGQAYRRGADGVAEASGEIFEGGRCPAFLGAG